MRTYQLLLLAAAVVLASCSSSQTGDRTSYRGGPPGPGGEPFGQGPGGSSLGQRPSGEAPAARAPVPESHPGAADSADRFRYAWKVEGAQDRRSLTVQEAAVIYGMDGDAVEPLWINLVFLNPLDRPVEIFWNESSLSTGLETYGIDLPTRSGENPASRIAVVPAKGHYAQSIALKPDGQDSPAVSVGTRRAEPEIRVRIIYRESSGKLLSSFSVVLTPPAASS